MFISHRARTETLLAACFILVAVWALSAGLAGVAQGADPQAAIDQHLAAGEFAAALQRVDDAPAAQRDELLQEIATAQNEAGARRAAERTLARIGDDRLRAATVDHILAQRFGPPDPVLAQIGGGGVGGGGGGSSQADFDAIIELMTKTIEPDSWDEVGGPGSVAAFESGVVVDAEGVLRRTRQVEGGEQLRALRQQVTRQGDNRLVRNRSPLRKVSLPRLEKAVQLQRVTGQRPDDAMQLLAGLTRIQYVFAFPDTGDLIIAGPAGDWRRDDEGRIVNVDSGRPVVQLDDLVTILRRISGPEGSRFGCSITPTGQALARTKAYVAESARKPLKPGRKAREQWLEGIRQSMGRQDVEVYGVDPGSRVAQILVEADLRMKLVGMGLEKGTDGVTSYLDSVTTKAGDGPPPMDVLRWWFTMNYSALHASPQRDAFEIRGDGVQVLSENEMLTALGKRVHTGKSEELNRRFASSFTSEFAALAARYPIYAELQNVFDMALVAAIFRTHDLPERVGWHISCFADANRYAVPAGPAPRQVDTVINHRLIGGKQVVAFVSGGVRVDPTQFVRPEAIRDANSGPLVAERAKSPPPATDPQRWWWD